MALAAVLTPAEEGGYVALKEDITMIRKIKVSESPAFDPAERLKDKEGITACLTLVIEAGDPSVPAPLTSAWTP